MRALPLLLFLTLIPVRVNAGRLCVDAARSKFHIHVGSAGLFGAFGHDHLIEARGIQGCGEIDTAKSEQSSIDLTFTASDIKVIDPDHPKDRPKVQQTMEADVLKIAEFPEIRFKSLRVAKKQGGFVVDGTLTIRGRAQNVSIPLSLAEGSNSGEIKAHGQYAFKQSLFGIQPISLMGGAVRVKDELKVEFDLVLR
jgi:polyisoprenoid-binding protein YceI